MQPALVEETVVVDDSRSNWAFDNGALLCSAAEAPLSPDDDDVEKSAVFASLAVPRSISDPPKRKRSL